MNMAITDGLALMPPAFAGGLDVWSRVDGTPGTATWAAQPNATLVASDQDFGGCLEMVKTTDTQSVRYMGQTPLVPGLYLRVRVKIKALAGALPTVRVAAWAGDASGANVTSVPQIGPETTLTTYGEVVEVTAIIGAGNRPGVDMVWGVTPTYGHFGFDLTGPNGGTVRIDDIVIEDATDVFTRKLMDWVDVRDFGAKGDGTTDDSAAFEAADAAANGRSVLVSSGTYFLASSVTFESTVRFEGQVTMPDDARLSLTRNFDLTTYEAAFGDELTGLRKALQALFAFTDHTSFDLSGRQVQLTAPLDVAAIAGLTDTGFLIRRVLKNGKLVAQDGTAWDTAVVTAQATYSTSQPRQLSGISNVSQIEVGSLVTGTGVGREVYVTARNVGAGTVTLSQPLYGAAGIRNYTFMRFRYMLDFSGFSALQRFELRNLEFECNGVASAVMLARDGLAFHVLDCFMTRPKDRAITSCGVGCQGMMVDNTYFVSNEQATPSQDRTSIVVNTNANDVKLRGNLIARFAHFAVLAGTGGLIVGNHFYHGDNEPLGVRQAGIVLAAANSKTTITGNYVDNCFLELTNEYDANPDFTSGYSFGGLTIEGNIFTAIDVNPAFRFMVVKPYGSGHFIQGLNVSGNVFKVLNGSIDRVDGVDATFADLNYVRFRNIIVSGNTFNAVDQRILNPVTLEVDQNTAAPVWTVETGGYLPFGGWARTVTGLVPEGAIVDDTGARRSDMPYAEVQQGANKTAFTVNWAGPARGRIQATVRADTPT